MFKDCKQCGKKFRKPRSCGLPEWYRRKHCSRKCQHKSLIGRISPKKGKHYPQTQGKNHYAWKGDKVGYNALHSWVVKYLGRPDTCEHCDKSGLSGHKVQWASKSHKYKRDLADWVRLCPKCHSIYDEKIGVHNSKRTEFKKGHIPWHKGTKGKIKAPKTAFKKGQIPWNKGKKLV